MKDHNQHEIQMSEAFLNSAFLALSGGFQDAYTYNARNEVFCNAQTGNVVLMSQHFMAGGVQDWGTSFLLFSLHWAYGLRRKYRQIINMLRSSTGGRVFCWQKS